MKRSRYDKVPSVPVPGGFELRKGWEAVGHRLKTQLSEHGRAVLVVDTYPGVNDAELLGELEARLKPALIIRTVELKKPEPELLRSFERNLTDDRIFGFMSGHELAEFFAADRLASARSLVENTRRGLVLVYGVGADLVARGDLLVYADMARWELQLRYRRGLGNWGAGNGGEDFFRKYKRSFFVEWCAADRHKFGLFERFDFFLDTHIAGSPKMIEGRAVREALRHT